ncbi:MAG: energy transducer TonB [Bacteroidales bacterium]
MEIKKSPKANLEDKRLLFLEIGLILSLAVIYFAFNMQSKNKAENVLQTQTAAAVEEEVIPITTATPPPPPSQPKIPLLSDQINIVDDDIKVDDDLFVSLEDNQDMGVQIMDYVTDVADEEVEEAPIPFALVEEKPSFMGGDANTFSKWVAQHIVYPEIAKENGVAGRVTLQFTIMPDGTLTNVKILRGVDASLDKEAVRVVSSSPKWKPGKQRDRAVKVIYNFPVIFQLR